MTKQLIALVNNRAEIAVVLRHSLIFAVLMILGSTAFVLADANRVIFGFSIISMFCGTIVLISIMRKIEITELSNEERGVLGAMVCLIASVSLLLTFCLIHMANVLNVAPVVEINTNKSKKLGVAPVTSTNVLEEKVAETVNFVKAAATNVVSAVDKTNSEALLKRQQDSAYIVQVTPTCIRECDKFGIPASIIIAQACLESDYGRSKLAKEHNCHFGIKETREGFKGAKIASFEGAKLDRLETSKFRTYSNRWESFRDHSLFLMRDNYKGCRKYKRGQWEQWAYALEAAGYADDSRYAEKLIHLIRKYHLDDIDSI